MRHFGRDRATIVGHDWGGFVAWHVAMTYPELTDNLIIFNLPHPRGLQRELAVNQQQKLNSAYARRFQQDGAHLAMSAEQLAGRHADDAVVQGRYLEAFQRSDFEAMLNYYKANYPAPPYYEDGDPLVKVRPPVFAVPRAGRHCTAPRHAQPHLGVAGTGPDACDDPRRRALGCDRAGTVRDRDDAQLAGAAGRFAVVGVRYGPLRGQFAEASGQI